MEAASIRRSTTNGLSIVELLVVILTVAIVLAFAVPSFINLSPSRKAKIAEISAILEKARARAMASQRDVYVCFSNESFPEPSLRFRLMGIFTSSSLSQESNPVDIRELRQQDNIVLLPNDLVFVDQADLMKQGRSGLEQTVLDSLKVREFSIQIEGGTINATLPYLLFNKAGRLEVPFFSDSETYIAISDGNVNNGQKILYGDNDRDLSELIRINYQTGAISTIIR